MTADQHEVDRHVGKRIRLLRDELQISQASLAALIGCSMLEIGRYETGEKRVCPDMLYTLSCFFEVPVLFFYQGLVPRTDSEKH